MSVSVLVSVPVEAAQPWGVIWSLLAVAVLLTAVGVIVLLRR